MKKTATFLLAALLILSAFSGCATLETEQAAPAPQTRIFTDSLGRHVTLPASIETFAVTGPMAQIVLFALAPDKLVGVANAFDASAAEYLDAKYIALPELGQLYGGKGEMNLETLLESGAEAVIDVGEAKGDAAAELDALSEQTGIPFVHITASIEGMGESYRALGALFGMPDEAEELARYCERAYERTKRIAEHVEKKNLLYITGEQGLNVIAKGSYHAEIIDLLGNNLAVVDEPSGRGTGNEVDMEQILVWNPEVILFSPESVFDDVGEDPVWQGVSAIKNGAYYEVPFGPYNWMGFPPSAQRYLGMLWMSQLLYPEEAGYDLYEEVAEYFRLFYHAALSRAQFDALVEHSIGRQRAGNLPAAQ